MADFELQNSKFLEFRNRNFITTFGISLPGKSYRPPSIKLVNNSKKISRDHIPCDSDEIGLFENLILPLQPHQQYKTIVNIQ